MTALQGCSFEYFRWPSLTKEEGPIEEDLSLTTQFTEACASLQPSKCVAFLKQLAQQILLKQEKPLDRQQILRRKRIEEHRQTYSQLHPPVKKVKMAVIAPLNHQSLVQFNFSEHLPQSMRQAAISLLQESISFERCSIAQKNFFKNKIIPLYEKNAYESSTDKNMYKQALEDCILTLLIEAELLELANSNGKKEKQAIEAEFEKFRKTQYHVCLRPYFYFLQSLYEKKHLSLEDKALVGFVNEQIHILYPQSKEEDYSHKSVT